jgi:hypothetical protein
MTYDHPKCNNDSDYRARCAGAVAGSYFPTDHDLRLGIPLFRGNVINDLKQFKKLRLAGDDYGGVRRLVNSFLKSPMDIDRIVVFGDDLDHMRHTYQVVNALQTTVHIVNAISDLGHRVDTYRLYAGDADFAFRYINDGLTWTRGYQRYLAARFANRIQDAFAYGNSCTPFVPGHFPQALSRTSKDREYDLHLQSLNEARLDAADKQREEEAEDMLPTIDQLCRLPDPAPAAKPAPGLIVFPIVTADGAHGDRKLVLKSLEVFAGKPIPLIQRGDIVAQRARLVAKFPHAADAIDLVFRDLGTRDVVDFRPVLFHGSPGCGKTRLAREIGDVLGLPWTEYGCGGHSDGFFAGVTAGWSSARPSVPVELIRQNKIANPLVILDELEKSGGGTNGGSLTDAILPFIERRQSSSIRDKALEINVDLSGVNYIATANDLNPLRGPILDRFRVVTVPDPGPQHLGDLVRTIVEDIAEDQGFDPRMIEPLDGLEEAVIRKVWHGGSLRRLGLAVTRLIEARDRFASLN